MTKKKKIHSFTKVLVFMFVLLFAVGYTSFSDNVASTVYAAETVYNIEGTEYDINNATTTGQVLGIDAYIFDDGMCILIGTQTTAPVSNKNAWTEIRKLNANVSTVYADYNAAGYSQSYMFSSGSYTFGDDNLSKFFFGNNYNSTSVTSMSYMFYWNKGLTAISAYSNIDATSVTNMTNMFSYCSKLTNLDALSNFSVYSLSNTNEMFAHSGITNIDGLSSWTTPNLKITEAMFKDCSGLVDITGLSGWNMSNVTAMNGMFYNCSNLVSIDGLQNWDVSNVTNMESTFLGCTKLTSLSPLSNWNTQRLLNMQATFNACKSITTLEGLQNWNVSSVDNMKETFKFCNKLTSVSALSGWNTQSLTTTREMFYCDAELNDISGIKNWNMLNVTDIYCMFYNCSSLVTADLSTWEMNKTLTSTNGVFNGCSSLHVIKTPKVYNQISLQTTIYKLTDTSVDATGIDYIPASTDSEDNSGITYVTANHNDTINPPSCASPNTETHTCNICGRIILIPVDGAFITHSPGALHKENQTEFSWDEVIRCTVCNSIMFSNHVTNGNFTEINNDGSQTVEITANVTSTYTICVSPVVTMVLDTNDNKYKATISYAVKGNIRDNEMVFVDVAHDGDTVEFVTTDHSTTSVFANYIPSAETVRRFMNASNPVYNADTDAVISNSSYTRGSFGLEASMSLAGDYVANVNVSFSLQTTD